MNTKSNLVFLSLLILLVLSAAGLFLYLNCDKQYCSNLLNQAPLSETPALLLLKKVFIVSTLTVITSVPPVFGFGLISLLSGFILPLPLAFLVSYCSSLIGFILCYYLSNLIKNYFFDANSSSSVNKTLQFIENLSLCIKEESFVFLLAVRLAPFPYNLVNLSFSMLRDLSCQKILFITSLANFKLIANIYVGGKLSNLKDIIMKPDKMHFSKLDFALYGFGAATYLVSIYFVNSVVRKALKRREINNNSEEWIET